MDNELWKPVLNYDGFYEVSSEGRVRSLGGRPGSSARVLKHADTKGYCSVSLSVGNKRKTFQVHRLVIDSFYGHMLFMEINHKDGNKKNNRITNLEWVSHKDNMTHAVNNSLVDNKGENHGMHKLSKGDVIYIRSVASESNADLARRFDISERTISDIKLRKSWKHIALDDANELK